MSKAEAKPKIEFNKQQLYMLSTLFDVLKYHTWGGNEQIMQNYILDKLTELGFELKVDDIGNIYGVRGDAEEYPLLNAHMDIVYSIGWSFLRKHTAEENEKETKNIPYAGCYHCTYLDGCMHIAVESAKNDPTLGKPVTYDEAFALMKYAKGCGDYKRDWKGDNEAIYEVYDPDYKNKKEDEDTQWWRKNYNYGYDYGNVRGATTTTTYSYSNREPRTDTEKRKLDIELDKAFALKFNEETGKITSTEQRVLGGDDKCGIALAIAVAYALPKLPMKILFTTGEEHGCVGISHFVKHNVDWFKDVKYSITIDRRGDDNLLMWSAGGRNCSNQFASKLAMHGIQCGIPIKVESGTIADVIHIREHVPEAVNISAGYYSPHSTSESIEFVAMCKILNWLKRIVTYI